MPDDMSLEVCDLSPIPIYNEDVRVLGYPAPVREFRDRISASDALLFATPEYNYSIPGVLKNAIDWASRPPKAPLVGKPFGIVGASTGNFGTVRAQAHLRQVCASLDMHAVNRPEVLIARASERFNADGRLTDETARGLVRELLQSLMQLSLCLESCRTE
jgi:chromate reductase